MLAKGDAYPQKPHANMCVAYMLLVVVDARIIQIQNSQNHPRSIPKQPLCLWCVKSCKIYIGLMPDVQICLVNWVRRNHRSLCCDFSNFSCLCHMSSGTAFALYSKSACCKCLKIRYLATPKMPRKRLTLATLHSHVNCMVFTKIPAVPSTIPTDILGKKFDFEANDHDLQVKSTSGESKKISSPGEGRGIFFWWLFVVKKSPGSFPHAGRGYPNHGENQQCTKMRWQIRARCFQRRVSRDSWCN